MKKFLTSIAIASFLGGSFSVATANMLDPYDADFARMNQYFNSLIEAHFNSPSFNNVNYPRTDIQENAEKIVISFDLAGVDKKNIKLSIDDRKVLTLEGEKKEKKEEKSKDFVKKEIFYGSFKRVIQLPKNINENQLSTKFKNGILTVTIPKLKIKKPKAKIIPIK